LHTIPQRRLDDEEGTALAYSGVMPIAQPTAGHSGPQDARVAALPMNEVMRKELAAAYAKRREAEALDAGSFDDSDNLYDNVACTD
jgi:hypothetical protein